MKTVLFIAMMGWGPNYPDVPATAYVLTYDMKTETACAQALEDEKRFIVDVPDGTDVHGKIGNLPGYWHVQRAWCDDPNSPWPMFDQRGRRIQ
ncbi:MAG: hypothetical protein IH626_01720 [Rhodospirillales bacterium]|nr:hypothetical protein [Rhodospirillales bacterium]